MIEVAVNNTKRLLGRQIVKRSWVYFVADSCKFRADKIEILLEGPWLVERWSDLLLLLASTCNFQMFVSIFRRLPNCALLNVHKCLLCSLNSNMLSSKEVENSSYYLKSKFSMTARFYWPQVIVLFITWIEDRTCYSVVQNMIFSLIAHRHRRHG